MKQRILAVLIAITLCISSVLGGVFAVQAEEAEENIDYSYLLTDGALIGYTELQSWGVYLLSGHSIINKMSSTKIGAGGATSAAKACEVTVVSIVERKTSTGWAFVTSWSQTNENAFSAMISRSLIVGTGYYYRVRSHHYASTDASTSSTSALWMGN